MKTQATYALLAATLLSLLPGCVAPASYMQQDTARYTAQNTEKFMLLDQATQHSVGCTGLQERILANSLLEVVVNIKNREQRQVMVDIQVAFLNAQGVSVSADTPWRTLTLAENATEAVRFTATDPAARKYSIRLRQAR